MRRARSAPPRSASAAKAGRGKAESRPMFGGCPADRTSVRQWMAPLSIPRRERARELPPDMGLPSEGALVCTTGQPCPMDDEEHPTSSYPTTQRPTRLVPTACGGAWHVAAGTGGMPPPGVEDLFARSILGNESLTRH